MKCVVANCRLEGGSNTDFVYKGFSLCHQCLTYADEDTALEGIALIQYINYRVKERWVIEFIELYTLDLGEFMNRKWGIAFRSSPGFEGAEMDMYKRRYENLLPESLREYLLINVIPKAREKYEAEKAHANTT